MEKRKGFTLVEILVVIAVIALLVSILTPTLQRARNRARVVVCQANLRQWGTILSIYSQESGGELPRKEWEGVWLLRGPKLNEGDPNVPLIYHNFTTKGVTLCPMATKPNKHLSPSPGRSNVSNISNIHLYAGSKFAAWEITSPAPAFRGSYGFNQGMFKINDTIDLMKKTDRMPILGDCGYPFASLEGPMFEPPKSDNVYGTIFCLNRHDGGINILFLDWSVRKVGLKELWTLKWSEDFNTNNRWTIAGGVKPEDWPEWMRGFKDY